MAKVSVMPDDENRLRTALAASKEENTEITVELNEAQQEVAEAKLAIIASEEELADIHSQFFTVMTDFGRLALMLAQKTGQLDESNQELAQRTSELQASNDAIRILQHEKKCFIAALGDFENPIVGSNRILEYIAAGKASPERQPEILKRLIGFNKNLLTETERLTAVFKELSLQTTQLDKRNIDLEEANAKLKAMKLLMQQREDFVAALTHDLKNPLIGGTKILEYIVDGTIKPEEQQEILSQVIESNKSMLNLIWNMMEVYKSDSGCLVPAFEAVDVAALMRESVREFSFALRHKEIAVLIDFPNNLHRVNTDPKLLRRVFMNLLDNAVKFTPKSGWLIISASSEAQEMRLSIKNSGKGLTDVQVEQIFDRFWQSPQGQRSGIGTGLGLFLAKQIIESLGSTIECNSNPDLGTEFVVMLKMD